MLVGMVPNEPTGPDADVRVGRPRLAGALVVLTSSLPMGIVGFVFVVTTFAAGLPTSLVWVGIPLLMALVAGARGLANVERARVRGLLGTSMPRPYRPLPTSGPRARWGARVRDAQTWRDVAYLVLLLPLGIAEFALTVAFWSASLGLVALPVYYRFLPAEAFTFPTEGLRWLTVDSVATALPWAALGVLFVTAAIPGTRALAVGHARLAAALL